MYAYSMEKNQKDWEGLKRQQTLKTSDPLAEADSKRFPAFLFSISRGHQDITRMSKKPF